MKNNNNLILPLEIYSHYLTTINSIKFSKREIDILACVLSGKSAKGIAYFLSISPKTAEAHTYNVMKKLDCTSREGVSSLIESSDKFLILKKYYVSLLTQIEFEKSLKKVANLTTKQKIECLIGYWQTQENIIPVLHQIKNHLILAGVQTSIEIKKKLESPDLLLRDSKIEIYTICVIPEGLRELEKTHSFQRSTTNTLFIYFEKGKKGEFAKNLNSIDFTEPENYYFSVFEILKGILPNTNLESIIEEFRQHYKLTTDSSENKSAQESLKAEKLLPATLLKERFFKKRKRLFIIGLFAAMSVLSLGFFVIKGVIGKDFKIASSKPNQSESSIRSDLVLPSEATLLNRPELMVQINEKFKGQGGIQTVALVGIGGAGKTTLARHYAHQQQAKVIWEINAETKGSLIGSFENLAYALATKKEDKQILRGLQEIKDSIERKEKIVCFVKDHLKLQNPWLLIYDNVENFSDIQKYFPQDSNTWGEGKIVMTTRNNNIQNSSSINQVIPIGELSKDQKLNLFMQIINHGESRALIATQKEKIEFLKKIPPFPLDISVAAYYLKTANIPYIQYIKYLNQYDENFTQVQKNLLKEAGEYAKTRYSIITASVKQLVDAHKDFGDLLLFISLLDSQNIPRDLLDRYKNDVIVDNFIYHLKKYSLIMNESSIPLVGSTLSVHRSTQAIALLYLTKTLDLEKNKQLTQPIANVLESYLADIIQKEDFTRMKIITNHCKSFLNQYALIGSYHLGLSSKIGYICYLFGCYSTAQKILEEALNILGSQEKIDYLLKAEILSYLGNTYKKLGDNKKAGELLQQNLAICKQYFPENDIRIAKALTYLGSLYRDQGKYEKAKNFLEESLAIYKTHLPDNPNETARTLTYLGNVYKCIGQPEKARGLLEKSLALYKTYLPKNHVNIAWTLVHLSAPYRDLKEYERALKGLEQGIEIYKNHFSENHIEVAWALTHLGHTYRRLGDYTRAKLSYQKSLSIYKKFYGNSHLAMGRVLRNLGHTYILAGNIDGAEEVLHQALEIYSKIKHPDIYQCFKLLIELNLRKYLNKKSKESMQQALYFKDKAINYLKQATELIKTHFPEESKRLIKLQNKFDTLLDEK